MNQKKCPKCGELNPPEAVMCWACYTPLTGGAVAATTATARSQAPARPDTRSDDDDQKTGIAPWQIGAVVVALLLAGGGAFMMTRGGSSDNEVVGQGNKFPNKPPTVSGVIKPGTGSGISIPLPGGGGSVTIPQAQTQATPSFSITTPVVRGNSWSTVGIVPNTSVTTTQALALAVMARKQLMRGRSLQGMYVFVFQNRAAAGKFQAYQKGRQGAPLSGSDYSALGDVWESTLVRYEYNTGNKGEDKRFPSANPDDWWTGESNYTPAQE